MKPAGKAGAEYEDAGFAMLLDGADVEALESGGSHASVDKLPDADFFNGAHARRPRAECRNPIAPRRG